MEMDSISRRDLLRGGVSLTALALFGATGGCEAIKEAIEKRPVRRDVTTVAAAADVATYRDAVSAMKALPPADPRNWNNQALIHQNFCPHGNWFFLPWHRAYLFYFERICRELTGQDDFALPYWNWQKDRAVPAQFWGAGNALFHSPRSASPTSQAQDGWVGPQTMEDIFDLTNFEQFASYKSSAPRGGTGGGYGSLEATPHNNIHGFVGGTMGTFMSPLDPVFWCHHNMIDCCWVEWNINRHNANINDSDWLSFTFTEFVNGDGSAQQISIAATVLMPLLSYRFETSPKGKEAVITKWDSKALRRFLEVGGNIPFTVRERFELARGVKVELGRPASGTYRVSKEAMARATVSGEQGSRLLLQLANVTPPAHDDAFVRVFVNKPDASAETSIRDPHYAGSFAFFQDDGGHDASKGHRTPDFFVDITKTVRALRQAGEISEGDEIGVRLVAVPYGERDTKFKAFSIGRLDLVTTPVAVKGS